MSDKDTAVLLLSHGSSLSYGKKVFTEICEKFKDKTDFDAEVGYMKVEKPNMAQAIDLLKLRNPYLSRIIAIPVFLASGIHTNIDIPLILGLEPKEQDPRQPDGVYPEGHYLHDLDEIDFDGEILLEDAIGANPKLIDIINNRVETALKQSKLNDAKTGVLLISHGSRLKYNKEFISAVFQQYEAQTDYPSGFGFMELAEPNITDSANFLIKENDLQRLVVVPVFIAPGVHTKIDIKTILNLIYDERNDGIKVDESKNNRRSQDISLNKIILEEDPDHAHKYDDPLEFDGEVLYPDPIGSDDILVDILVEIFKERLNKF